MKVWFLVLATWLLTGCATKAYQAAEQECAPAAFADYPPTLDDEFVLVDVSDYHHFDPLVVLERVVEVIDHHPGYEHYWAQKLGSAADIRPIGAAATQVNGQWTVTKAIMSRSARVLMEGFVRVPGDCF